MIRNLVSIAAGAMLLTGCALYPYETAFQECDDEAGICYRFCEDAPTEAAGAACRQGCDSAANQCFDDAYGVYNYSGSAYAYSGPWYGSYGYWRPGYGYIYSFDYYLDDHRRRDPYYDDWRRNRHGYGRGRNYPRDGAGRGRGRNDDRGRGRGRRDGSVPPPASPPPGSTPPPPETGVAPPPPTPRARPPKKSGDRPAGEAKDGRRIDKD